MTHLRKAVVALGVIVVAGTARGDSRAGTFRDSFTFPAELDRRTVTVTGIGELQAPPDQATASIGVIGEGPTAVAAMQANSEQVTALLKTLREAGIASHDVQTSQVSVQPTRRGGEDPAPAISGYRATNRVTVRVRSLDRLGPLLDRAVAGGANQLENVEFGFRQPAELEAAARRLAMLDARETARQLARGAQASLGEVVSVDQEPGPGPQPLARALESSQKGVPLAPGESSITSQVRVTYELVEF